MGRARSDKSRSPYTRSKVTRRKTPMNPIRNHRLLISAIACAALAALLCLPQSPGRADLPPDLKAAEAKRIEVVKKVQPAVVAIFAAGGQGGGSGVLIDQ